MFKGDQEASILALQQEVQRLRTGRSIPINSPVGESESNGRVENAIRRVQDKVRTLRAQIEGEAGIKVNELSNIMSWMVRWAAELVTKHSIGKDGKTAQERLKGRASNRPIAMFGEHVLYLPLDALNTDQHKIDDIQIKMKQSRISQAI